jgi:23S rRNA (cytidine1920-2'-O)/16S rRNA (cytidine1409-2'-O)-methyltransferase
MAEVRLDKLMVQRGLASSRARAEEMIVRSGVRVDGAAVVMKPSKAVPEDAVLEPLGQEMPWVGRGALKLVAMIEAWPAFRAALKGAHVLDVGASTGGFTQVALQHGALSVCAVDAGRDQLHETLRFQDDVWSVEQTKIQDFGASRLLERWGCLASVFAIDVSFTGLEHVLPSVAALVLPGAVGCILVKPQFEVGPAGLSRAGIVRNERLRLQAIDRVRRSVESAGFDIVEDFPSPVSGGDGNIEHLLGVVHHIPPVENARNCTS